MVHTHCSFPNTFVGYLSLSYLRVLQKVYNRLLVLYNLIFALIRCIVDLSFYNSCISLLVQLEQFCWALGYICKKICCNQASSFDYPCGIHIFSSNKRKPEYGSTPNLKHGNSPFSLRFLQLQLK